MANFLYSKVLQMICTARVPRKVAIWLGAFVLSASISVGAELVRWDLGTSLSGSSGTTSGTSTLAAGISGASPIALTGSVAGTASSSGWRWYDGSNSTTSFATDLSSALAQGNYFSWSVTAASSHSVSIQGIGPTSFSRGNSASTTLALLCSSNNTWTEGNYRVVAAAVTIPSSATDLSPGLSGDLGSAPLEISPGGTIYFRLLYWGATTTSSGAIWIGNSANDLSLLGTATPLITIRDLSWAGGDGTWAPGQAGWTDVSNSQAANWSNGDNASLAAGGATLTVDAAGVTVGLFTNSHADGTLTLTGGPVSAGSLQKNGAGRLVLANSNALGAVTLSAGALELGHPQAAGAGSLSAANSTLSLNFSGTLGASALTISGPLTMEAPGSSSAQIGAAITLANSGATLLTKTGTGSLLFSNGLGSSANAATLALAQGSVTLAGGKNYYFSGTNSWAGGLTLSAATLQMAGLSGLNNVIEGTGSLIVAAGTTNTLKNTGTGKNVAVNKAIVLNGTLTNDVLSGQVLNLSGGISGAGDLAIAGNGRVDLAGTNSSFTGRIRILGGTAAASAISGTEALGLASEIDLRNTNSILQIDNSSTAVEQAFRGKIIGAGSLIINGSSLATTGLYGSNTFTGGIRQLKGSITVTNASGFGRGTIAGETAGVDDRIQLSDFGASMNLTNAIQTGTTNTHLLTFNVNTNASFPALGQPVATVSGPISGLGKLKLSGGGTLALANASNSFTGGIEIGTGKLSISAAAQLAGNNPNFGTVGSSFLVLTENMSLAGITGTLGGATYAANLEVAAGKTASGLRVTRTTGGNLVKWGGGSLEMAQADVDYHGTTEVKEGVFRISGTGYTATLGATSLDLAFSSVPANGTFQLLPAALVNAVTFGSTGATGKTVAFDAATGAVAVADAPVSAGFGSWIAGYPSLAGASAERGADPDGDRMSNSDEYAFGTDPTAAGSRSVTSTSGSGQITLTWLQRNDVTYTVQSSDTLSSGFPNTESGAVASSPQPIGLPSGYSQHEISIITSGARNFLRVQAVVP